MLRSGVLAALACVASSWVMRLPELSTLNQKSAVGTISDCSSAGALAQNFMPSSNSTNPKPGDWVGLMFEYDIAEDIPAGATADYSCTINGFLPYSTSADLCGGAGSPECPMPAGHRIDDGSIEVVSGVSKLKCTINWAMKDGREILCATASWTVA